MRLASVRLTDFRRFQDVNIQSIPPSARLVVLAGPNGSGKSSLFDGFLTRQRMSAGMGYNADPLYYFRDNSALLPGMDLNSNINVAFHGKQPVTQDDWKRAFYIRSAYRNESDFTLGAISTQGRSLDQVRFGRLSENDAAVSLNYSAMTAKVLYDLFHVTDPSVSAISFREMFIDRVNAGLMRVFDDLTLTSLGVPGEAGWFYFTKGKIKDFHYKNLSGGEKAGFDLLLDFIAKQNAFNNTIFCIDEPEAHLNTRVQARLLRAMFELTPDNCQLWVATHAIGMMRSARDLYQERPGEVCFLDFGGRDFDEAQVIDPVVPTPAFWRSVLEVALDDLSSLVAPDRIVVCEGTPAAPGKAAGSGNANHDARCYNAIFARTRPGVLFVSGGNSHDVSTDRHVLVSGLRTVVEGATITRLIDLDDNSESEVQEYKSKGVRVLRRRHLESYLWSEEILSRLCESEGKPEAIPQLLAAYRSALAALSAQGKSADDVKSATGIIYNSIKAILGLSQAGSNAKEFMRARLAPLVTPDTTAYAEIDTDIFGTG